MNLKNLNAENKSHKFFDLKLKDSKIKSIYQKFEKKVKLFYIFTYELYTSTYVTNSCGRDY